MNATSPMPLPALALAALFSLPTEGGTDLNTMEQLASRDLKPFVVIEASDGATAGNRTNAVSDTVREAPPTTVTKGHGQGVLISPAGHVLSAGHVSYLKADVQAFAEQTRISFRAGRDLDELPAGVVHEHTTNFDDMEGRPFYEFFYDADLLMLDGSRYIGPRDLCVYRIDAKGGDFPCVEFYARRRPRLGSGDVVHLCHYVFPDRPADPHFMVNPITVVGVVDTPSGLQYLAKGYYRVGSSGGAILKDGKLIGIQSSAYTVNASRHGEVPLGFLSFHLVWEEELERFIEAAAPVPSQPAPAESTVAPAERDATPDSTPQSTEQHGPAAPDHQT